MFYKIITIGLMALSAVFAQTNTCNRDKKIEMNQQPLDIKVECRENERCLYEEKDIFLDINIINNQKTEVAFPLEFAKGKGPIIRLVDTRTKEDTYLPNHPADTELLEKYTMIKPGESVVMKWVITSGEIEQFGGDYVDLSAEITILTPIAVNEKKIDFRGSDTVRIVSKIK